MLLVLFQIMHGQSPFLTDPLTAASACPAAACLNLPEDSAAPPVWMISRRAIDSAGFYARSRKQAVTAAPLRADTSRVDLKGYKTVKTSVSQDGVLVQQAMELEAKGEPAPGLKVEAHLVDHDAGTSETGATTTLRQTEEVWVDARTRNAHGRLGDLSITEPKELLGGVSRTARGLLVEYGGRENGVTGAAGAGKSRWLTVTLNGVEGQQEGYQLTSSATDRSVVPGSEKVALDGAVLTRGKDYDIHNDDGTIDFRTCRRIRSGSRITVEYQAADQNYRRTLVSGGARGKIGGLQLNAWAFREADDPASPLSYVADTATQRVLREAGNDTSKAHLNDSVSLPLPESLLRTGLAGNWTGKAPGAFDLRWMRRDPNSVSSAPDSSGAALAWKQGWQGGTGIPAGGTGIWKLTAGGTLWQKGWQPAARPTFDTSSSRGWATPSTAGGAHDRETVSLGWEAEPGLGVNAAGQHFFLKEWADVRQGELKAGVDRDSTHQAYVHGSAGELDRGVKLQRRIIDGRVGWEHRGWEPFLRAEWGGRDDASDSAKFKAEWREAEEGLTWRHRDGSIGGTLRERVDKSCFGGSSTLIDSARTLEAKGTAQAEHEKWGGEFDVNWLHTEIRENAASDPAPSGNWLAEATAHATPVPGGLSVSGHYKLTTSSWRPTLAIYDTVPWGTGKYSYDSTSGQVIADEFGNLLLSGYRLDTLHSAVRTGTVSASFDFSAIPREITAGLGGILADIGMSGHLELEQVDSNRSRTRFFPSLDDSSLSRSMQGKSGISGNLWWEHGRNRLDFRASRSFQNVIDSWSSSRSCTKGDDEVLSARRSWNRFCRTTFTLGRATQLRTWSSGSDTAEKFWFEPQQLWQRGPWDFLLFLHCRSGESGGTSPVTMTLWKPGTTIGWKPRQTMKTSAGLQAIFVEAASDPGTWLADGYPYGLSWRAQADLDWKLGEHLYATAGWVLRIEPRSRTQQKVTLEAKAVF